MCFVYIARGSERKMHQVCKIMLAKKILYFHILEISDEEDLVI